MKKYIVYAKIEWYGDAKLLVEAEDENSACREVLRGNYITLETTQEDEWNLRHAKAIELREEQ